MAVPRCVLCCSLRGGIARTTSWSDGFRQAACFSSSVVILIGLQPSLEGSTVGRKPGHGTSRVTKSRRRIGRDQPTEMGERRVSERTPMVDGFRYPLATRHPHVSTTGGRQPDRSRQGGSQRDPRFVPLLFLVGIPAVRLWYPGIRERMWSVRRTYVGRMQSVRRRTRYAASTRTFSSTVFSSRVSQRISHLSTFCHYEFWPVWYCTSRRPAGWAFRAEVRGVRYVHFYVFWGPGVYSSGHTGSLPGCAEQGVLFPGGAKVKVQVDPTACRFLKAPQPTQHDCSERGPCFQRGSRIGTVHIRLGVTSSLSSTPLHGHSTLSHQLVFSCSQVTLSSGSLVWWSPVGLHCVEGGVKSLPNKEPVQERGGEKQ